ncbi:Cu-Zn family superoxide dismutase [Acinetobacter calcoaceticus]|uniref:Superoxide dismutase [Cu-Zn] n=1 Tax=Acinetobacter calcoaceticus TaxID=471 RepID=A0A4R1XWZ5_ACICA|nr:Cu-Zn family superoxide dismutase [Acinetobacter calcoaceticus]
MPTHFLKASLLSAIIAVAITGCSTTTQQKVQKNTPQHVVDVQSVTAQGVGASLGQITFTDSPQGLRIKTQLKNLPAGFHGFHIHETGLCQPAEKDGKMVAALAAGGHYNPTNAQHGTPNDGHLGDLPVLNVDSYGNANTTVVASRLKLADVQGRAIMIHAGGDNYSDTPKPLGGGGDRIACGVIR